jgi:hypothetical protein
MLGSSVDDYGQLVDLHHELVQEAARTVGTLFGVAQT